MILILLCALLFCSILLASITLVVLARQKNTQLQVQILQTQLESQNKDANASLIRLEERGHHHQAMVESVNQLLSQQQQIQQQTRANFDQHQINTLRTLQESLQRGLLDVRQQVTEALTQHGGSLTQHIQQLTQSTDQHLKNISGQVEKRLSEGFEKTTATFTDVVKRLALIDEAQKKITELSANIVSLQSIFSDKRSRGAFGEVQLSDLVRNVLPESHYVFQCTLSNGKRADCLLKLPDPNGNIVIDSKFPLENYQNMIQTDIPILERQSFEQQFKKDIQKHIKDIAEKYIISGETADSALMFVPAEAIFAEIHSRHADLVEAAQKLHVWIVSPTTMWAILTTARAVIKDVATRKQVHIIQKHLHVLGQDFERFKVRMDNLAKHIRQAHEDTQDVYTSSRKISGHFSQIEKVELEPEIPKELLLDHPNTSPE